MPTFDEHDGFQIDYTMLAAGLIVWPTVFMTIKPSDWFTSSSFFKYAAILFWFSILGHTQYGIRYFYPYLKYVPNRTPSKNEHGKTKDMSLVRWGALNTWNFVNFSFLVQGLISWQWSYTNGPVTTFDHIIFWSTIALGMLCGSTFFNHGWYQPLVVLVMAPAFMVIGYTLR